MMSNKFEKEVIKINKLLYKCFECGEKTNYKPLACKKCHFCDFKENLEINDHYYNGNNFVSFKHYKKCEICFKEEEIKTYFSESSNDFIRLKIINLFKNDFDIKK